MRKQFIMSKVPLYAVWWVGELQVLQGWTLHYDYASGPTMVVGRRGVSYGQGTPVRTLALTARLLQGWTGGRTHPLGGGYLGRGFLGRAFLGDRLLRGLGFRISGFGFRVLGLGLRV
jgi:hypothetical protein